MYACMYVCIHVYTYIYIFTMYSSCKPQLIRTSSGGHDLLTMVIEQLAEKHEQGALGPRL